MGRGGNNQVKIVGNCGRNPIDEAAEQRTSHKERNQDRQGGKKEKRNEGKREKGGELK